MYTNEMECLKALYDFHRRAAGYRSKSESARALHSDYAEALEVSLRVLKALPDVVQCLGDMEDDERMLMDSYDPDSDDADEVEDHTYHAERAKLAGRSLRILLNQPEPEED